MKLEIEVGQIAVAIESRHHHFKNGEEIKFVEYGVFNEEDNYYEYVFESVKNEKRQWLESNEFELTDKNFYEVI